ncbi:MAG: DMT family transporter [Leptospira sp.]|nr:DMT family transporter [Leptospira sp.]
MNPSLVGIIFVFVGSILFSAKAVLVKLTYLEGLDSIDALTLRLLFALPFFVISLVWLIVKKRIPQNITQFHIVSAIFYGFLGYYLASLFDFIGLEYITAGLERLVLFIYPTLVVLLNFLIFKRKLHFMDFVALLITYSGIIFAYLHDVKVGGDNVNIGVFCVLISAISYAVYLLGSGHLIPKLGTQLFTSIAMITSCILVFIQFSFSKNWSSILEYNSYVLFLGFLLGIFTTVVPSFLISAGIHRIGSSKSSILSSVGPVSTLILAKVFLGEELGVYQIVGTVLVLSGVLIISQKKKEANTSED